MKKSFDGHGVIGSHLIEDGDPAMVIIGGVPCRSLGVDQERQDKREHVTHLYLIAVWAEIFQFMASIAT